ncbi:MAG: hypothetical protein Q7S81_03105 [bacterium]|nr:hypothetical protein [bacterium]
MNRGTKNLVNTILSLLVISVLGGLGYLLFSSGESFVPENFIEARGRSAIIASELVSDLNISLLQSLPKISEEDKNGRFSSALGLVEQEIEKIQKVKDMASKLSIELTNMAQAIQGIKPVVARNLALEAVSQEVSMINHLLNYNNYFYSLLETLKLKFSGDIRYDSSDVQVLIENMNKEAKEINSINDSFNQKLKEFDSAIN